MAAVHVKLLGGPLVTIGGAPVALPRKKSVALLAVLSLAPAPLTRADLIALLWPSLEPQRARAVLRSALSDIRQVMGADVIVTAGEVVALDPGADIDVLLLRAALVGAAAAEREGSAEAAIPSLERAAAIAEADLLPRFKLPDDVAFTAWCATQAERLREDRSGVLSRLVELHAARGDTERALQHAEALVAAAPTDLSAYRRAIEILLERGDRAGALDAYSRCLRVLSRFNQQPDRETRALLDVIRGHVRAPAPAAGGPSPGAPLPVPKMRLVGRQDELRLLEERLRDPGCRLVTITGLGGAGKTRLGLEAAHRLADRMRDGVTFVPLLHVRGPEHLPRALADAIAPRSAAGAPDPIALLRRRQALLLLDGFEHLMGAAVWLAELLAASPEVKVLATSRERLHLRGEWEVQLAGLRHDAPAAAGERAPAIELFVQCASRSDPTFSMRPGDDATVARICEQLGGMPLGIELAAAWVRHYGLDEIARRLQDDLDFLTAPRDAPESQRNMRATFARSWGLLPEPERVALRRLSIFLGPFDEADAAAVAGATSADLASLGSKFFLHRVAGGYSMHSIVRRYAAEELRAHPADERAAAQRRNARFLELCVMAEAPPGGQPQVPAARIVQSIADVREAFADALRRHAWQEVDRALHGFFSALSAEGRLHIAEAQMDDIAAAVRRELATAKRGRRALRRLLGRALLRKTRAALERHPRSVVDALLAESASLLRATAASEELGFALNARGKLAAREGELVAARRYFLQALRLCRESGDRRGVAAGYNNLAVVACCRGDYARAERLARRSLHAFEAIGDRRGTIACLSSLAELLFARGDREGAEAPLRRGIAMAREAAALDLLAALQLLLGKVLLVVERTDEAEACLREALALVRASGQEEGIAAALIGLGTIARLRGELDLAERLLAEGLSFSHKLESKPSVVEARAALGLVRGAQRRRHEARMELLDALRLARELGAQPLLLDVLASIAEARAFGVAHALETAQILAAEPSAGPWVQRRAQRVIASAGPEVARRRAGGTVAELVDAMLAAAR